MYVLCGVRFFLAYNNFSSTAQ